MTTITDEMRKVFWESFNAEYHNGDKLLSVAAEAGLAAVAPLIVAAEREECAKVAAGEVADFQKRRMLGHSMCAPIIAAAIRARSA